MASLDLTRCLAWVVGAWVSSTPAMAVTIDAPLQSEFVSGSEIGLSGRIATPDLLGTTVVLDGTPLGLFELGPLPDGRVEAAFSALLPVDFAAVFNAAVVEWTLPDGSGGRDRVTFVGGPFLPDGEPSPGGAALRFNDSGLDDLEPAIEGLVGFDLEALLPVGLRIYNKCLVDTFAGCVGRAKVYIDDPAPSYASQQVALDARSDGIQLDLRLEQVRVDLDIRGSGVVPDCRLRLTADAATIAARYALGADPADADRVDLNESAPLQVDFDDFDQNFTGGTCNDGLIEDVIHDIIGDLKGDIRNALAGRLRDPDGAGPADGPLSEAVEGALAGVEIAGPIGASLDVDLRASIADVRADDDGLTILTDTLVSAVLDPVAGCDAPAGAPVFAGSHAGSAALPLFLSTTPGAGLPYDVALSVTDAGLDQGLRAFTECGLLHADLEALEPGGAVLSISAGLLALFDPAFGILSPDLPLTLRVRPSVAPILAAGPGPQGALAALRIADLRIAVVDPTTEFRWLLLSVDATAGLDFDFNPGRGELLMTAAGALADVEILVLDNPIGADEAALPSALGNLLESGIVPLADDLGRFALPPLLGLRLTPLEIDRTPGAATFYFEATVPEPSSGPCAAAAALLLAALARRAPRRRPR